MQLYKYHVLFKLCRCYVYDISYTHASYIGRQIYDRPILDVYLCYKNPTRDLKLRAQQKCIPAL